MKALINKSQIKHNTGKAILVTLPNTNSKKVWIPEKLVYPNSDNYTCTVYLPDSFTFNGISGNAGKNRFDISADELSDYFEPMSNSIVKRKYKPSFIEHVPDKLKAVDSNVDDSLKR